MSTHLVIDGYPIKLDNRGEWAHEMEFLAANSEDPYIRLNAQRCLEQLRVGGGKEAKPIVDTDTILRKAKHFVIEYDCHRMPITFRILHLAPEEILTMEGYQSGVESYRRLKIKRHMEAYLNGDKWLEWDVPVYKASRMLKEILSTVIKEEDYGNTIRVES